MENQEGIDWLLNKLSKQASDPVFTRRPIKGAFEIRESKVEGLKYEEHIGQHVDCVKLTLSLWFVQELRKECSIIDYTPEHCVLKEVYHVTGMSNPLDFYNHFIEKILRWVVHSRSEKGLVGDSIFYGCSDLIRNGLDGVKDPK